MKRFLVLVIAVTLTAGFIASCSDEPKIEIEPTEIVSTSINQEFTLSREFDLNSGYMWREDYGESVLELVETAVETDEQEGGEITLLQVFRFKALKKGKTVITLVHARPTLDGLMVAQQDIISVNIK